MQENFSTREFLEREEGEEEQEEVGGGGGGEGGGVGRVGEEGIGQGRWKVSESIRRQAKQIQ